MLRLSRQGYVLQQLHRAFIGLGEVPNVCWSADPESARGGECNDGTPVRFWSVHRIGMVLAVAHRSHRSGFWNVLFVRPIDFGYDAQVPSSVLLSSFACIPLLFLTPDSIAGQSTLRPSVRVACQLQECNSRGCLFCWRPIELRILSKFVISLLLSFPLMQLTGWLNICASQSHQFC